MSVTITSPTEGAVLELTPNSEGRFSVTVSGTNSDTSRIPHVGLSSYSSDAEPDGWFWSAENQYVSGTSWSATFHDVPYSSEYRVAVYYPEEGWEYRLFSIRRPLQIMVPAEPGAEVPLSGLRVEGLLGANIGDTVGVAIPQKLGASGYASSPPFQVTGEYQPIRSDYHTVREGRDYLLEVWLKADLPGSRLTIEWDRVSGFGTTSPTGDPEDLMAGEPGEFIVNNLELPTEWTRYRMKVNWTLPGDREYPFGAMAVPGLFHFNQSTGSEQNAVQSIAGLRMVPYPGNEETWASEYPEIPGHPDAWIYMGTNRIPYAGDSVRLFPVEMETRYDNPPDAWGSWSNGFITLSPSPWEPTRLPFQGFPNVSVRAPGAYTLFAWIQPEDPEDDALVLSRTFTTKQFGFDEPPATPEVKVLNGSGFFQGEPGDIAGFSVSEDAVPTNLVDLSGGIASMTLDVMSNDDTEMLMHRPISLADPNYGEIIGEVTGVEMGENGIASVTADSALRRLVRTTVIEPTSYENMAEYLRLLFEDSGFSESEIDIVEVPSEWSTLYPGGERELWTWLKELLSLHGLEAVMVGTRVRVRRRDTHSIEDTYLPASISDEAGLRRTITEGDAAREVSVTFHETEQVGRWTVNPPEVISVGPLYPAGGWSEEVKILQVDAGESLEETLDLNASIFSVEQPECVVWVDRNERWNSVYSVSGNDGLPIVPQQWIDAGGSLTVRRSDDTRSLIVTLTGANLPDLAPFQIAMSAGPSDRYSSLRLMGSGVILEEKTLTIPTAVSENLVFNESAPSIDSELITNLEEAYTAAVASAKWHSGSVMEVSGFEADLWRWRLFGTPVDGGINLQSFGNMAGSRFRTGRRVWRIQTVDTTPEGSQFTAREDTTFREFQRGHAMYLDQSEGSIGAPYTSEPHGGWKQQTFEDFNAEYAGMTFSDFTTRPLRRDDVPSPPELTNHWENFVLNPSFEQSLANWFVEPPGAAARPSYRDIDPVDEKFGGMGDFAVVLHRNPDEDYMSLINLGRAPVVPGQWVGVRLSVKVLESYSNDMPLDMLIQWHPAGGGFIPPTVSSTILPVNEPRILTLVAQAPAAPDGGALSASMTFHAWVDGNFEPASVMADGAMLVVADSEEEVLRRLNTYVDGDTPDNYERVSYWEDGNSPSARENSTTIVRDTGE